MYQIAQYQGDSLEVKESIKKVYHSTAGMEIRSYKSTGMYFMFQITVQPTSVLTKASVWYEIWVLGSNINHVKSHTMVLAFSFQTDMNQIFQRRHYTLL